MAKFSVQLEVGGVPTDGLSVQVKTAGTSTVVASTSGGTITDNGDGTYISTAEFSTGEYDVYAGGVIVEALTGVGFVDPDSVPSALPVPVSEGGTGASSVAAAQIALGLQPGVDVQAHLGDPVPVANGGTGSSSALAARAALGLEIGTDVQAHLGDPVPVANGGTGSSNALVARATLGLEIGADVQAHNDNLDNISEWSSAEVNKLEAFAGISFSSANLFPVLTVEGWMGMNQATAQAALGLEPGSDVAEYDHSHDGDYAAIASNTGALQVPLVTDALPTAGAEYVGQFYYLSGNGSSGLYFCIRTGSTTYKWANIRGDVGGTDVDLEYSWSPT